MMYGVNQYAKTQVQTASSVQVIVLLYDGTIQSLKLAKAGILTNNYQDKARFLERALRVVSELSAALDMDRGGTVAVNLRRVYEYVQFELLQANLHHDPSHLEGPIRCLSSLQEAWQEVLLQDTRAQAVGT